MLSTPKRPRMDDAVNMIRIKRVQVNKQFSKISDAGWQYLDPKKDSLKFDHGRRDKPELPHFAVPSISRNSTEAEVFFSQVPASFVSHLLERRMTEEMGHFVRDLGNGRAHCVFFSVQDYYYYLACRAWIQACYCKDRNPYNPKRPLEVTLLFLLLFVVVFTSRMHKTSLFFF